MAVSEDSIIIHVALPREFVEQLDRMKSPTVRSRAGVVKRIVENALGYSFVLPVRSASKTEAASAEQAA
jgi:metal-responsive CopG/Arc/MetJ family transcriptional regulator